MRPCRPATSSTTSSMRARIGDVQAARRRPGQPGRLDQVAGLVGVGRVREVTTTWAPSSASRSAVARPMPVPAPVTRATRSCTRPLMRSSPAPCPSLPGSARRSNASATSSTVEHGIDDRPRAAVGEHRDDLPGERLDRGRLLVEGPCSQDRAADGGPAHHQPEQVDLRRRARRDADHHDASAQRERRRDRLRGSTRRPARAPGPRRGRRCARAPWPRTVAASIGSAPSERTSSAAAVAPYDAQDLGTQSPSRSGRRPNRPLPRRHAPARSRRLAALPGSSARRAR